MKDELPLSPGEFVRRLVRDEGATSARATLDAISERGEGSFEEAFNVWNLYIDVDRGTARYDHDFLGHKGTLPLTEFIEGLEARLITEEHL